MFSFTPGVFPVHHKKKEVPESLPDASSVMVGVPATLRLSCDTA
jgi:hypothetical protein